MQFALKMRKGAEPRGTAPLFVLQKALPWGENLFFEEIGILLDEILIGIGDIILVENRDNRTYGLASSAFDACIRVNVVLIFPFMNAIYRTGAYAVCRLFPDTGRSDDKRHGLNLL
jgi:hypothetical protein